MGDALSKRQARSVIRLSSGATQSLIQNATDANTAYHDALRRGASQSELRALALAGLEAAERLHSNIETIIEATIQARASRWRSRQRTEAQVQASLGPRQAATARAIDDWRERVSRHAVVAASPTDQPTPAVSRPRTLPAKDRVRHVPLLSDGSGVTFERQAGEWVWRFDPGVPENVTTTALAMAELKKLQLETPANDDGRDSATNEQ